MKLAIATNSVDKINGIKSAFSRFFNLKDTEVEIFHQAVESGVPEQPFDEKTYLGAQNRVKALISSEDIDADYYVSCKWFAYLIEMPKNMSLVRVPDGKFLPKILR